mgnify:CR=1 FL=1
MGSPVFYKNERVRHTSLVLHTDPDYHVDEEFIDEILAAAKVRYLQLHTEKMKQTERDYIRVFAANLFTAYKHAQPLEFGIFTVMPQPIIPDSKFAKMTRVEQKNIPLSVAFRQKVVGAFIQLGYCEKLRSGFSFKVAEGRTNLSVFRPNELILEAITPLETEKKEERANVVDRDVNHVRTETPSWAKQEERILKKYNRHWRPRVNILYKPLTRAYINGGKLGGRLYSDYQLISGKDRPELLKIDGERVVEIDFKASQLNIASLLLDGKPLSDDPYTVGAISRDDMKMVMMYYVNSTNPKSCCVNPSGPVGITGVEYDEAIAEFESRYPSLKRLKGTGFGLAAQKIEGDVFMELVRIAMERDTVVLTVHDSIIVKESEAEFWKETMNRVRDEVCKDAIVGELIRDSRDWILAVRENRELIKEADVATRQTEEFKAVAHDFIRNRRRLVELRLEANIKELKLEGYTEKEARRLSVTPVVEGAVNDGLSFDAMEDIDHKLIDEGRLPKYFI